MDSEKIIIYVVLGIIYYGYRYFFKSSNDSKKAPKGVETRIPNSRSFSEKGEETVVYKEPQVEKSIFDLLEEIKKQEKGRSQPDFRTAVETSRSLEGIDYELEPQKIVIEDTNPYQYTTTKIEEKAKKDDSEQSTLLKKPHPLLATMKNTGKVKEAFIIGEILTKRY